MYNYAYDMPTAEVIPPAEVLKLAEHRKLMDSWNILLAEDDPSDVKLTEISLSAADIPFTLHTVTSGKDVLPNLRGNKTHEFLFPPDLVILDLSLPDKDGFEVLAELANAPEHLKHLPIFIVTGFEHYRYITQTYDLWIPAYISKPCTSEKIQQAFDTLRHAA
jgi:CheY-like chemotaxis protein